MKGKQIASVAGRDYAAVCNKKKAAGLAETHRLLLLTRVEADPAIFCVSVQWIGKDPASAISWLLRVLAKHGSKLCLS